MTALGAYRSHPYMVDVSGPDCGPGQNWQATFTVKCAEELWFCYLCMKDFKDAFIEPTHVLSHRLRRTKYERERDRRDRGNGQAKKASE